MTEENAESLVESGSELKLDSESISSQSVSRKNSTDNTRHKYMASAMACEVASLSSMTSNYSQFDFFSSNQSSVVDRQQITRAPSPPKDSKLEQRQKRVSNPLAAFFFPNSFFNRGNKKVKYNILEPKGSSFSKF